MVSKCANPLCSARMKYMHDGSVFAVRKPPADPDWMPDAGAFGISSGNDIEWFWLCKSCSRQMRISNSGSLVAAGPSYLTKAMPETAFF